jgi:hypothetical protein
MDSSRLPLLPAHAASKKHIRWISMDSAQLPAHASKTYWWISPDSPAARTRRASKKKNILVDISGHAILLGIDGHAWMLMDLDGYV